MLEGGDVQHDLRMFVEDLVGDGSPGRRTGGRAGLDGRRSESAVQRVVPHGDTMATARVGGASVRDRRAHQGRVPRVEPAAICHGPSHAGRTGLTVSATDRGGARRDHPSRPPHGAGSPRAGRPGRDRAEDRTQDVTLHRNDPTDVEGLRPRSPRSGDLPERAAAAGRRRQGADLPALSHGRLGRGPGPAVRPDALEHLPHASTRCGPGASSTPSSNSSTTPSFTEPGVGRRDPGADARAGRRQGPATAQGPQGAAPVPGQPLRSPAAGSRAGNAPVPQDELPEVPGQRDPVEDSTPAGPRPPTSTRSNGSRKRRWPSRTRSSGPTSGWSSRSPSGTSARRTTSSSWSPTATCR